MPSISSQLFLSALGKNRSFFGRVSKRIMDVNPSAQRVAHMPMLGTKGSYFEVDGVPAMVIAPQQTLGEDVVLLHCHGGAYVSGNLLQSRVVASHVASAACLQTYTFTYRLSPAYPYPAQLEDALKVYHYLLDQGYKPQNIGVVGESAGGNLALALSLYLKQQGQPLPGCLVLLSPWTDLSLQGDSYTKLAEEDQDVTLDLEDIVVAANQFVGEDPSLLVDPLVSPIHGDFTGFPPTQIQVGTRELLLSDGEALAKVMERDQVDVTLLRWEGMPHVFQIYGFPESRLSMKTVGRFIKRHLVPMVQTDEMAADEEEIL